MDTSSLSEMVRNAVPNLQSRWHTYVCGPHVHVGGHMLCACVRGHMLNVECVCVCGGGQMLCARNEES